MTFVWSPLEKEKWFIEREENQKTTTTFSVS